MEKYLHELACCADLGVAAMSGIQFIDRMKLVFMPAKYQPDYVYLRYVRINRVHLFTGIQVCTGELVAVLSRINSHRYCANAIDTFIIANRCKELSFLHCSLFVCQCSG